MTTQNMIEKAYSTTPTASTIAEWDANVNLSSNNFLASYTTTVTAAGTTTLTVGSTQTQFFTGATTQTVKMPVTSTLGLGYQYYIVNTSSGVVTVQSSGSNTIIAMAANTVARLTCILTSGTTAASWFAEYDQSSLTLPLSQANGGTGGSLGPVNNAVFSTDGSGNGQLSATLPSGLAATNLTLTTPALGTPASGTLTNCTDNRFSKAWANFNWNGSSIVINKSFNITSITHVGTGNYTINFTNNMADANYAVCTGINSGSGTSAINATTLAVGSFKIFTFSGGAANDPTAIFFTVFD